MIKKNNLYSVLLAVFFLISSIIALPAMAGDYGLGETVGQGKLSQAFSVKAVGSDSSSFISSRLGLLIGAILSFIGVIFMVLIIFGGFMWMLARGNEQQVDKARDIITRAIIGLIIVLSAYAITAFIGEQLTDVNTSSIEIVNFYC